jgi:hypothetical protein
MNVRARVECLQLPKRATGTDVLYYSNAKFGTVHFDDGIWFAALVLTVLCLGTSRPDSASVTGPYMQRAADAIRLAGDRWTPPLLEDVSQGRVLMMRTESFWQTLFTQATGYPIIPTNASLAMHCFKPTDADPLHQDTLLL